jgi:formiminoglutamate deiminase
VSSTDWAANNPIGCHPRTGSRRMRWFARHAELPGGPAENVLLETDGAWFTSVQVDASPGKAHRLPGVVLPGFANAHSHAFHRALRGRTHDDGGTFWTWRERMYAVADRLDPDGYLALARATYAEMALAGVTSVGEFHYLHHAAGGARYDDPNVMAESLRQAAAEAGVRLTLLDTCYLAGGLAAAGHIPPGGTQLRFRDGDAESWAARVQALRPSPGMLVGAAVHSARTVPRDQLATVADTAAGGPLHVHLSEQPAENEACLAYYGCTPTALLDDAGMLGPATTAVHATHLTSEDIATLGRTATTACLCPTTERDLADGIGPALALRDAGSSISLGSDQHAIIDLIEEARSLEMHERLRSGRRGRFSTSGLLTSLTAHDSLGWPDAGRLEPGARADLVAVRLDSPHTAGSAPGQVLLTASAVDVDTVVIDGEVVVSGGRHRLGDVAQLLADAIMPLWAAA